MPIYEYACSACNHQLEKLQKMSDAPLVDCPACGNPALQKKISAARFQLKGTGWYATDFKPGAAKTDNRKNSSENSCQNGACPARCQGESAAE